MRESTHAPKPHNNNNYNNKNNYSNNNDAGERHLLQHAGKLKPPPRCDFWVFGAAAQRVQKQLKCCFSFRENEASSIHKVS